MQDHHYEYDYYEDFEPRNVLLSNCTHMQGVTYYFDSDAYIGHTESEKQEYIFKKEIEGAPYKTINLNGIGEVQVYKDLDLVVYLSDSYEFIGDHEDPWYVRNESTVRRSLSKFITELESQLEALKSI
jgi:hypothetical protein